MKIDLHVHSKFSRRPSEWILKKLGCPESFTEPLHIYHSARARGMSHVTITDHNAIDGALEIAHLPGVFIGEEVTTYFPEDGCKAHVLVQNITESQHRDIQHVRNSIFDLAAYLHQENIFHILAHPLYPVNDRLTADHVEQFLLLFDNFELNGARNNRENQRIVQLMHLINAASINSLSDKHGFRPLSRRPVRKRLFGGSDDHSSLNIARTYTEIKCSDSTAFFLDSMRDTLSTVHAKNATPRTLAHNIYSIAWQFYRNKFNLKPYAGKDPLMCFLDSFLLSTHENDHPFLSKVYSFLNARSHKKRRPPRSDVFLGQLRFEADRMIRENPGLIKQETTGSSFGSERENVWFEWVNQLSSRLLMYSGGHLLDQLSGADVFNALHTISSSGGLYALLSPYFVAYAQFTSGREVGEALYQRLRRLQKNPVDPDPAPPLNIAHFTDTFYEINGVARTLQQQVKLAAQSKKQYTLITCNEGISTAMADVKHFKPIGTYALPEYPEQKIFYPPLLEMLDFCHRENFNHIHTATPGFIGLAALCIAKVLKTPISGTYHTALPQYVKILTGSDTMEAMTWKFILWYYDQLDMILVPSLSTRKELVEKGLQAHKIKIYPRGIDIAQFHPSKRNGFFNKIPAADQKIKFLYIGRISKEKNLQALVDAFKHLSGTSSRVFLTIVGDGPFLPEMQAALAGFPCFFAGYLEGEDLSAAYASSDVFVFPSTTDTFGNVVLEAQASGIPVIVTDQGGPAENMIPEKTGIMVNGPSEAHLYAAMKRFAEDDQLAGKMGAAARRYSEGRSFKSAFLETWDMLRDITFHPAPPSEG